MINWLSHFPHLEPFGDPLYFVYIILATLPIFIGLFFKKRFAWYELLVSAFFIASMLFGTKNYQVQAFLFYVVWQTAVVFLYQAYRRGKDSKWVFFLFVGLAILPLVVVKFDPIVLGSGKSILGFMGISYLTFKSVAMIMEMRDGLLKDVTLWAFLRFLIFMPTISSGPIDRFRRFNENYEQIPDRDQLMRMLDRAVWYIMLGFFYKFVLAHVLGHVWLPQLKEVALRQGGLINLPTIGVMYTYGLDLFFDFAGYSMFAIAISHLMGIETPQNFDQPFKSRDLKEFWNRWHMSLSFWFRDFVFMRLVKAMVKNKVFSNRNTTSSVAYLINMTLMGFWHGLTWYYVAYGVFHGVGLVVNDMWIRKKKSINKERKAKGQAPLPDNKWTKALGIFITFNVVMVSFLLFSGFLNQLWFHGK
ncbi:D-alanyl-lipoteichoic acid biosynthesis protein DltB [Streptococcus sp. DD13]|uniref:D-alanyl-lipoteichoic acid biosynthesis protein DltB n=1 Tax=Streptococcus sp. DD13 TaxID=1777881 RepID=UPI0007915D9A|nr:D-alanyl-lipoteichoic acid biosynthesis protein DltB [Streptococcus sp. DD13]KXT78274.1 D-alanyl transfer protein DltB [Streptococcus sp. DD13]